MNATTRAGLHVAITDDGAVVVDGDQNTVTALGPIAAAVFQLADGTRDQAELLRAVGAQTGEQVEVEVIWSTLDRLADAGLLVERVTPPAGAAFIDRRSALRKAAAGTAAVGAGIVFTTVLPSIAAAASSPSQEELQKQGEQQGKIQGEQTAKESTAKGEQQGKQTGEQISKEQSSKGEQQSKEQIMKEATKVPPGP